jgi:hypothetical protein
MSVTSDNQNAGPALNLPEPRIWTRKHLADFLGVSTSWVYQRTMKNTENPIPRIVGVGRLKFDTASPQFQEWMRRQLGYIDREVTNE